MPYNRKTVNVLSIVLLALAVAILILFSPFTGFMQRVPFGAPFYGVCVLLFWLLLFIRLVLKELLSGGHLKYRSILDQDNRVQKLLIKPTGQDILSVARIALSKPVNIVLMLVLLIAFIINHLMLFHGVALSELPGTLFGMDAQGKAIRSNIWLFICSITILLLCTVIINQNYSLKQSNKVQFVQNLIINAHSKIDLEEMLLRFVDMDKMFLTASKQEYLLNAKPLEALLLPGRDALLEFNLETKLYNDFPLREFYIRQLTLFVDDISIACENYSTKYHNIYEVNHTYILKCFIHCRDVDYMKLVTKIAEARNVTLYYHTVIKNSFGVITDIYGSTTYTKANRQTADGLRFSPQESRANQQFYM